MSGYTGGKKTSAGSPFEIRTMPIAQVNETAMLFSSLESYENYEREHYFFHALDRDGVGVPLFQFRLQSHKAPVILIDKFVILSVNDAPPESPHEVKKRDKDLLLYKVLFCRVYLRHHKKYSSWEVEFTNAFKNVGSYELILGSNNHKGFIGTADGFDLSWRELKSPTRGEHELFVNYDDIHHLLSNGKTSSADNDRQGNPLSPQGLYLRNMESRNVKEKRNHLYFLEPSDPSDPKPLGLGISSVPAVTEFLSLHGILLHCRIFELMADPTVQKRRRSTLPLENHTTGTIGLSMGPA